MSGNGSTMTIAPFEDQIETMPATPVGSALANAVSKAAADTGDTSQFNCCAVLSPSDFVKAKAEAIRLVDEVSKRSATLITYGDKELEPLNQLVAMLLEQELADSGDNPELRQLVMGISQQMRSLQGKYASGDPDTQRRYNTKKAKLRSVVFFWRGSWEMFRDDTKALNKIIDDYESLLQKDIRDEIAAVIKYDLLIKKLEDELHSVIYVTAVMELASLEAARRASAITIDSHEATNRQGNLKADYSQLGIMLQNRMIDFNGRLIKGFLMSPSLRMSRNGSIELGNKLSATRMITLNTLREVVLRWAMEKKSSNKAGSIDLLREGADVAESAYQGASLDATRTRSLAVQRPLVSAQAITDTANALEKTATMEIEALNAGVQYRRDFMAALNSALSTIDRTNGRVSQAQIDQVLTLADSASPVAAITSRQPRP